MCMNYILNKVDDLLGWIERVHRALGDIGNFCTQYRFTNIIGFHPGNIAPIDKDLSTRIVQRREIISHQTECQR